MFTQRTFSLVLSLVLIPTALSAEKKPTPEQIQFFEKEVRPLLAKHCYRCHGPKRQKSDLRLDSRSALLKGGSSGPAIVVGNPKESLLIHAVSHQKKDLQMPPDKKLPKENLAVLTKWIQMGAPWPGSDLAVRSRPKITEKDRNYWAFRPLQVKAPPQINDGKWNSNPIDRWIKSTLDARNLKPVGLADRATLLRRVTYDLTGLPPTPKEISDFLKDNDPNAFAKVVDRLLASQHYGERWGRHWLDVVRYSDTSGCNSDFPIREAYRYRNYVIDALNNDLPYDQFLKEQLAGDLMPSDDWNVRKRRLIATGYLAQARRFGSIVVRYPWELTHDDTIDNLGKAMLGLTISCARCHDHKFDPILQTDYYAISGIFASTRYSFPGIELAPIPRDQIPLLPEKEHKKLTAEFEKKHQPMLKKIDQALAEYRVAWAKYEANPGSHVLEREAWRKHQVHTRAMKSEGKFLLQNEPKYPRTFGAVDAKTIGNVHRLVKGDPKNPAESVRRGFLAVLGGQKLSPQVAKKTSGRLQLAEWITKSPLTARVIVNRLWQHHFGEGLVSTPNNFGRQGQPPSHPELLDWLAQRLIEKKWSLKDLHREMLLTRVYQLDSRGGEENVSRDPDNTYLWRQNRQRLDAESLRDTLLFVSGELKTGKVEKPHPFPPVSNWHYSQHKPFSDFYEHQYRSVYLLNKRLRRPEYFATFDGADANASTPSRPQSVTTPQALYLMNHERIQKLSEKLALHLMEEADNEEARIELLWMKVLNRLPTNEDRVQSLAYLREMRQRLSEPDAQKRKAESWASLSRVLFRTNEMMYVD